MKAPAGSASPTRPVSRWEVRSPSPLRRQITAGQRPAPADAPPSACLPRLDSGCHVAAVPAGSRVEAAAPSVSHQFRPTGPERTTVTTEVKVSVGGDRHRTSMHLSPGGGPLRAEAAPEPPPEVTHVSRAEYRPAAARRPLPQHPDPPAAETALPLDDETVRSLVSSACRTGTDALLSPDSSRVLISPRPAASAERSSNPAGLMLATIPYGLQSSPDFLEPDDHNSQVPD